MSIERYRYKNRVRFALLKIGGMMMMDNAITAEYTQLLDQKIRLEKALAALPQGYISKKNLSGKTYYYLQNRSFGKMKSEYLKSDSVEAVSEQIRLRKQFEAELPVLNIRLVELEQAAQLIGHGLDRKLMLLKISAGMDSLPAEQKERSVSFADAMNAIEGVPASEKTAKGLADWKKGKMSYLSVFETTLQRYGFGTEV